MVEAILPQVTVLNVAATCKTYIFTFDILISFIASLITFLRVESLILVIVINYIGMWYGITVFQNKFQCHSCDSDNCMCCWFFGHS